MIFLNNFKFFLGEAYLSILIVYSLVYGVGFTKLQFNNKYFGGLNNIYNIIFFGLLLLLLLVFFDFNSDAFALNYHCICDHVGNSFRILLVFMTILVFLGSKKAILEEKEFHFEYLILILLALLGLLLLVRSSDFIFMYLSLELQSLCLYVLAASNKYDNKAIEASFKYFIFSSLASGIFLFGISILYGLTGTTNIIEIFEYISVQDYFIYNKSFLSIFYLGFICILSGFFFKLAIFPFHNWAIDVYSGVSPIILNFFSTVPKVGMFAVLIKLISIFLTLTLYGNVLQTILLWSGIFSIFIGTLGAIGQSKIRRLLAYSSISTMGTILIACSLGTYAGYQSAIFYFLVYILLIFSLITPLLRCYFFGRTPKIFFDNIGEMTTLFRTNPIESIMITCSLFSLIGVPPLMGFFGKYYILASLVEANLIPVVFFIVLMGVVATVYYLRLISTMYFELPYSWNLVILSNQFDISSAYAITFITYLNICFVYFIDFFYIFSGNIVLSMMLYLS